MGRTLAVLPRAPSFLDVYTHPERAILRQDESLLIAQPAAKTAMPEIPALWQRIAVSSALAAPCASPTA